MKSQDKRLIKNTIAQYLKIIISVLGTLIYTRIVLQQLGVEDYGLFSVIAGFIALFGVLNSSMIVAVQRFLSFEIPTKNYNLLNEIYSTSIIIHIIIAFIVIFIGETLGIYFIKNHMTFAPGKIDDAIFVFHCVIGSFAFNIISIPQQATLIAYEKIFISAIISSIEVLLKVISAFILCEFADNKLKVYSVLFVIISIIIRFIYTISIKTHVKTLHFKPIFNKTLLKNLMNFAGWNLLGAIANIGKIQGVNIILNMFLGTIVNAAYGIANQINGQLLIFSSSIFQSSNSQVIQSYRKQDSERLNFLVFKTSKFSFVLFFTIGLFVFSITDELLYIWLGEIPQYCSLFVKLMIINSCIELFSTPLMYITQATGKIRNYFIIISSIMILILPLSYIALKFSKNPYYVMYITIFINLILLYIRILFVKKSSNLDIKLYTKHVIIKSFIIIIVSCTLMNLIIPEFEVVITKIISACIISPILVWCLSYFCLLTPEEKTTVKEYVQKIRS